MLPVKKAWADPLYFYALPTFAQAKRVAWDPICKLIPPSWVKGEPNRSGMVIETVFGSKLYVVGMDKPARIEGVQWDGGVIDERSDTKPGTFYRSVVPALEHRNGWCWQIGVPKRFGVGALEWNEFFERGVPDNADYDPEILSLTWPSSTVLTPKQLAWAKANLDARDYNEQYNATLESVGGMIFYAFDEVKNVDDRVSYRANEPICVGSDFNVDPMCWTLSHRTATGLVTFDEIYLRNTNTPSTLDYLAERYGDHEGG